MKRGIWILIMAFTLVNLSYSVRAQKGNEKQTWAEKKAERKALKAQKKAMQDSIQMIAHQKALIGIHDTLFVLEANMVYDRQGNSAMVSETTNFVGVEKGEATVQLGFPFTAGLNGVGGITLTGRVTRLTVTEDKKGFKYIKMSVFGSSLNADINITLTSGTNRAEAVVSAATLPYKVRYDGYLYHRNESSVFKGTPLL